MKRKITTLLLLTALCLLTSCEQIIKSTFLDDHEDEGMTITSVQFSEDNTRITVYAKDLADCNGLSPDDSTQVRVRVREMNCNYIPTKSHYQPRLDSVVNIGVGEIEQSGLVLTIMVDLTQTSAMINHQREIVRNISHVFCRNNLMLVFMMPEGRTTRPIKATPYIIDKYIVSGSPLLNLEDDDAQETDTLANRAYLYRSLNTTLKELMQPHDSILAAAPYRPLMVLSDGIIYNDVSNMPLDPDHFQVQEDLIRTVRQVGKDISVYYICLESASASMGDSNMDNNLMRMVCASSGGLCYDRFDWRMIQDDMLHYFDMDIDEYKFVMTNPSRKLYFGATRYMRISLYTADTDSLLASSTEPFHLGRLSEPACVGSPVPWIAIAARGIVVIMLMVLILYVVLQLLVPYVRYVMFRRKNVIRYTSSNMSVNGVIIPPTCYFCKAPFVPGEKIVAACEHVMHEECWHENGDHCPEYGTHCTRGGHFYDRNNILNLRNASFYLRWILLLQIPVILAWVLSIVLYNHILGGMVYKIVSIIPSDTHGADFISESGAGITSVLSSWEFGMPFIMHYLAPLLTLAISAMTTWHYRLPQRILYVLLRAAAMYVITIFTSVMELSTLLSLNIYDGSFLSDWLPLTVIIFCICWLSTVNTKLRVPQSRLYLGSIAGGLVVSIICQSMSEIASYNDILYIVCINISVAAAVAVIIAQDLPRGERHTLHVTGPVKEMDIALYKWLRQSPGAVVTIGRSIDCSLQLSWDIQSDIAPIQARIFMKGDQLRIEKLDGSVLCNGKELRLGKSHTLYHGDNIQIGLTQFRYLEK